MYSKKQSSNREEVGNELWRQKEGGHSAVEEEHILFGQEAET